MILSFVIALARRLHPFVRISSDRLRSVVMLDMERRNLPEQSSPVRRMGAAVAGSVGGALLSGYLCAVAPLRSAIGTEVGPSTPVSIRVLLTMVVARRSKIVLVISSTSAIAPL